VGDAGRKAKTQTDACEIMTRGSGDFEAVQLPSAGNATKALFVGMPPVEIAVLLGEKADDLEISQSKTTAESIALVIRNNFEYVVVDQREENFALTLLVPLLASSEQTFKLIVICQPADLAKFLRIRGVDRVLTEPIAAGQFNAALGLNKKTPLQAEPVEETPRSPTKPEPNILAHSRNRAVAAVSTCYKNAAFVLLAILFVSFCFYGILIAYFLVSSTWGAPVTLSRGHELVVKVDQQVNDMKLNANVIGQRMSEAELEEQKAIQSHEDARLLVGYVLGTVEKEIATRIRRVKTLRTTEKRLAGLKTVFERQLQKGGMSAGLLDLYKKHLIDRKTFEAGTLGLMDAGQKLSNLDGNLADVRDEASGYDANIAMLKAFELQLKGGRMDAIEAASSDLILLTKQAVDARSAFEQSKAQMNSAMARKALLVNSKKLLEGRIAELQGSALGRAISSRIDVIFVPYGNERNFTEGRPLYTCALTIFYCHRAGSVGVSVPGESNAVHPFFGKPIRGYFVEAILDDKNAASQEIIHAGRPPFFF
jgi:hypothetical protein